MKKLSLEESQRVALDVLIKFDEICKKNDFKYFLMYGTLIGAIRHEGFIPWDDDIDVMMPRKDFDNFLVYAEKYANSIYPLKIHTRENTKNYWYGIPRLSNMNYKYVIEDKYEKDIDMGAFIDIYPLDNFGDTQEECDDLFKKCRLINRGYDWYINSVSQGSVWRSCAKKVAHIFMRLKKGKHYNKYIEKEIKECIENHSDDKSKYIGLVTWATKKVLFEREVMKNIEIQRHIFSGHEFNIPMEYDYMLKLIYEDYMALPPVEERIATHNYSLILRE